MGKSVAERFPGCARWARQLHFGRGDWDVVGVMDASGGAQNSEIWGDLEPGGGRFASRRSAELAPLVAATDAVAAKALVNDISNDQRLAALSAISEQEYYEQQTASAAPIEAPAFSSPSSWRWAAVSPP